MKSVNRVLFLMVTCALALFSCREKKQSPEKHTGVEYYRNILPLFSFYDTEHGIGKLPEQEAKPLKSYKFVWDDAGKLLSVEYTKNDTLIFSPLLDAAKIKYAYDGQMQIKFFFDSGEQPIEIDSIFAYQYSSNSSGERAGMMFLDKNGVMVNNSKGIHAWVWSRLDDGTIKETRFSLEGQEILPEARLVYNEKGELKEIRNVDKEGNLVNNPETGAATTKYSYDEMGNCIDTVVVK
ncbi:MAG TPA: hypothetical protein VHO68_15310 [Bacteroidales bacterium]|nr:hypothetical protein [Bacteroidales bacterium]